MNWNWYSFNELSNHQLYDLLQLRQDVFIIEQDCIYPDLDGLDFNCLHLLGYQDEQLIAYLRLIPAEFHPSKNTAFGRIISKSKNRGAGIGKLMVESAINYSKEHYPRKNIQLSAQQHLQEFYQKFGFISFGEAYDEDGIMHIDMLLNVN